MQQPKIYHALGRDWLIGGIALKPYPCCHFIHGYVDCALELRSRLDLDEIASIDLPLAARIHPMVSGPLRPSEPYAAMFSTPYVVALALVTGEVDLASFHDKGVDDPQVLAMSDRTTVSVDAASDFPTHFPGEVRITLKSGEVLSHRVATSYGTPERPMSDADVRAKYMANATRVLSADAAETLMRMVLDVERIGHVSELTRACTV